MTHQHLWSDLLGSWLESTGSYWKAPAWQRSGNSNYYTHITQTESILWHWNGNFLNCILQRYWMPGLVIHCSMSASLVSTGLWIINHQIKRVRWCARRVTWPELSWRPPVGIRGEEKSVRFRYDPIVLLFFSCGRIVEEYIKHILTIFGGVTWLYSREIRYANLCVKFVLFWQNLDKLAFLNQNRSQVYRIIEDCHV